jgi:hypothetical protein
MGRWDNTGDEGRGWCVRSDGIVGCTIYKKWGRRGQAKEW